MESLEARTLFSGVVSVLPLDTSGQPALVGGSSGAYDAAGNLWVANTASGTIDKIVNGVITQSVGSGGAYPTNLTLGPNGHLYFINENTPGGEIDEIDLTDPDNPSLTTHTYAYGAGPNLVNGTARLTVTTGGIWLICNEVGTDGSSMVNTVGHFDAATGFVFQQVPNAPHVVVSSIAVAGNNSVYVALTPDQSDSAGAPGILTASFAGGAISVGSPVHFTTSAADGTDPFGAAVSPDGYGTVLSVTGDGHGGVWYTLLGRTAEWLVHADLGNPTGTQPAFKITGSEETQLGAARLTVDGYGRVWYASLVSNSVGYFEQGHGFTSFTLPGVDGVDTNPWGLVVGTTTGMSDVYVVTTSYDVPLVKITPDAPAGGDPTPNASITFIDVNTLTVGEDTALGETVLATFSGPATGYTASIAWANGVNPGGTLTIVPGSAANTYKVVLTGATFATQGTYPGTLTVSAGSLSKSAAVVATVTDTPVRLRSFTALNLGLRVVIASVVFTDDVDATASQFTVTLDWGDGTSRGVVVRDPSAPGTFRVIGVHAYRRRGTYTLSAKVQTTEVGAVPTVILPGPTITV
jgi:hypothetical protein